jgi:hypothetical protein
MMQSIFNDNSMGWYAFASHGSTKNGRVLILDFIVGRPGTSPSHESLGMNGMNPFSLHWNHGIITDDHSPVPSLGSKLDRISRHHVVQFVSVTPETTPHALAILTPHGYGNDRDIFPKRHEGPFRNWRRVVFEGDAKGLNGRPWSDANTTGVHLLFHNAQTMQEAGSNLQATGRWMIALKR